MSYNTMESKNNETKEDKTDDELETVGSQVYGCFSWNPKWLQWMNNATVYMVLMTVSNIFQSGTTNGLMGAAQSSIEKRFELTSTQSSWIIIAYEIATVPLAVYVTYIGTIGCHRPRWTACFLLISCFGCFLYALPHFTTPVYNPSGDSNQGNDDYLCGNRTIGCSDDEDNSSIQAYMLVFILARICLAFGGTGLYNFSVTYLDDSVTRDKFSLYTSMLALGGVVGPALGFILGGYLLSIYTDFPTIDADKDLDFDQNDPRWVGAWWLGYVIAGFGLIISTLPFFGYPRDLPGAAEMRKKKVNEASGTDDDPSLTMLKFDFKKEHIKQFSIDVFSNLSFDFLSLFVCCDMAIIAGFTVFGPKYAEVQFSLTAGEAGVLFGLLVVPAGAIGAISGGLIIERLKLTFSGIVKTQFFVSVLVFTMAFPIFLTYCDQIDFAGVNIKYPNTTNPEIDLIDPCNSNCSCEGIPFNPVCHKEKLQFYSPCHAGCLDMVESDESKDYYNCSCISDVPSESEPHAAGGICQTTGCGGQLGLFSLVLFLAMVGLFQCEAMNVSSVIRVVPNSHRLFAMMVEGFIVRFLGTMPGPMIFGSAFDSSCLLTQSSCNDEGSCYSYDNSYLGYYMLVTAGGLKLLSCLFMFLAWKLYKPPKNIDDQLITVVNEKDNELNNMKDVVVANGDTIKDKDELNSGLNGEDNDALSLEESAVESWVENGITMTAL